MELTTQQHLENIAIAIENAKGTYNELTQIRLSFAHIRDLVLKEPKEEK
jgi:hypothetical protein